MSLPWESPALHTPMRRTRGLRHVMMLMTRTISVFVTRVQQAL